MQNLLRMSMTIQQRMRTMKIYRALLILMVY
jgi:hypothetical protein